MTVVIPDATGVTPEDLDRYAARAVAGARRVVGVRAGRHVRRRGAVGPPSAATGMKDGSAFLTVGSTAPLFSDASEAQLDRLHAVAGRRRAERWS